MIKGEIEQIKLKMNSVEVNALLDTYHEQEAINIMGKRYFVVGIDVNQIFNTGKAIVIVKVRAIKKG